MQVRSPQKCKNLSMLLGGRKKVWVECTAECFSNMKMESCREEWRDLSMLWPFQLVSIIHHLYRRRHKSQKTHMIIPTPDNGADDNRYNIVSGLWSPQHNCAPSVHQNPSKPVPRKTISNLLTEALWWATRGGSREWLWNKWMHLNWQHGRKQAAKIACDPKVGNWSNGTLIAAKSSNLRVWLIKAPSLESA